MQEKRTRLRPQDGFKAGSKQSRRSTPSAHKAKSALHDEIESVEPVLIQRHPRRLHRQQLPLPVYLDMNRDVRSGK